MLAHRVGDVRLLKWMADAIPDPELAQKANFNVARYTTDQSERVHRYELAGQGPNLELAAQSAYEGGMSAHSNGDEVVAERLLRRGAELMTYGDGEDVVFNRNGGTAAMVLSRVLSGRGRKTEAIEVAQTVRDCEIADRSFRESASGLIAIFESAQAREIATL